MNNSRTNSPPRRSEDYLLERRTQNKLKDLLKTMVAFANTVRPGHVATILIGNVMMVHLKDYPMSEGAKGGEFFTPTSIVKVIMEIIEPFHGRIYDSACGSAGH